MNTTHTQSRAGIAWVAINASGANIGDAGAVTAAQLDGDAATMVQPCDPPTSAHLAGRRRRWASPPGWNAVGRLTERAALALTIAGAVALPVLLTACTGDGDAIGTDTTTPTASSPASPAGSAPSSTIGSTSTTVDALTTSTMSTTSTSLPSAATTTTAGPTTAAPAAPASGAPTTSVALTSASLVLRSDGIGPIGFGTADVSTIARLTGVLDDPVSDDTDHYPVPIDSRYATDASGEEVFAYPYRRTTCYANGLCVFAGGATSSAMAFVGWDYVGDLEPALHTTSGVTVGSTWAEFPTMTVPIGGCYSEGAGSIDGIDLGIHSEGTPFGGVDDDGNFVVGRPDPADAIVTVLSIGDLPGFPALDC